MVRPNENNIVKKEKVEENEASKLAIKGNAKRKYREDENEDIDELILLNGLSVPKDGSVPTFKKPKKVATADKILKLEQEKV